MLNFQADTQKLATIAAFVFLLPFLSFSQSISFDDSGENSIIVNNGSSYEIHLWKHNGSFKKLVDLYAGVELAKGSDWESILEVRFSDNTRLFSRDFRPSGANLFEYAWNDTTHTLLLTYISNDAGDKKMTACVKLLVNSDNYFDLQLSLENNSSVPILEIGFHHNMLLTLGQGDRAYILREYPGLMLGSDFFAAREHMIYGFPDADGDYLALDIQDGKLCIYTLRDGLDIETVDIGLGAEGNTSLDYNYLLKRWYYTWVDVDSSWTSPVSRFRIGQDYRETLSAYRNENGINEFPSIQSKLGDKFDTIVQSPIIYHAFGQNNPELPFIQFAERISEWPNPSIIMLAMYYLKGAPGYSPDYLPPDPMWGTTEEFSQMTRNIQSQGKFVMPTTIPVWWHVNSPTILNLGDLTIEDIAQIKFDGTPHYKDHFGDGYYYVSPSSPFVQQKLDQMYVDIFETYGADMVYEDVIGGIGPVYDFNKNAPTPIYYRQAWLEHLKSKSSYPIITESGYDILGESVTGFLRTIYDWMEASEKGWDYETDDGFWRYFPTSPYLYRDKVISYNSWATQAINKDVIAWSLLFGCPLCFCEDDPIFHDPSIISESSHRGPWFPILHPFQKHVISRTLGKLMTDYSDLEGKATKAVYDDISVIRNWDEDNSYITGEHSIAPNGALVQSSSGDLTAGIMDAYNGEDLSSGDHYLIVLTDKDSIVVMHPYGEVSEINIERPADWLIDDNISIGAYYKGGIIDITPVLTDKHINFTMMDSVSEERIFKYKILYGVPITKSQEMTFPGNLACLKTFPNPFRSYTNISFTHSETDFASIVVYDIIGQEIRTLINGAAMPGKHSLTWDGKDNRGGVVKPGIYLVKLQSGNHINIIKILKI